MTIVRSQHQAAEALGVTMIVRSQLQAAEALGSLGRNLLALGRSPLG